ncbi:MAG: AAA family ATPase [Muribaculaceae bacterium]|nr:AAA family ATPase [Muribaculaceae bacterium]
MGTFRRYPAGVQDFEKIRTEGFVYVDKTRYVYELANRFGDAIFLSRPRRFGKSLLCSTLKYYFQGRKDLFQGLAMEQLETRWTQYPVLHFDMSRAKRDTANDVRQSLSVLLSEYEAIYGHVRGSNNMGDRLQFLIAEAHRKTGNKTVLIFDEYDSPVLHAIDDSEKMKEIRDIFNEFYGPVKSMAEHLRFVFITGITKFSQMSIFSTINNLVNISLNKKMEAVCGITAQELETQFQSEIENIALEYKCTYTEALDKLRKLYDGYHFGPALTDIYNPFSLLNAFTSEMLHDYWFASATPTALLHVLSYYNFSLRDIEGTSILKEDFNQPFDNFDSAVPILYQSGYLTIKDFAPLDNVYTLGIPNGEVYRGLYRTLMDHYLNRNFSTNSQLLITVKRAMRNDDINTALTAVQSYMAALPHHLSNKTEQDFETILRVLFDGIGIEVDTEVQSAIGRCDVVIKTEKKIYVLELKIDANCTVDDALAQITKKNYLIPFWNDTRQAVKVGVVLDRNTRTIKQWKIEEQ